MFEKTLVAHTAVSLWYAQRCNWHRCVTNFVDYLREFEVIRKGFNPCIRGTGEVVWWKTTRGRKSRDRVPLTHGKQEIIHAITVLYKSPWYKISVAEISVGIIICIHSLYVSDFSVKQCFMKKKTFLTMFRFAQKCWLLQFISNLHFST
jgi:hypothetical protein